VGTKKAVWVIPDSLQFTSGVSSFYVFRLDPCSLQFVQFGCCVSIASNPPALLFSLNSADFVFSQAKHIRTVPVTVSLGYWIFVVDWLLAVLFLVSVIHQI
jgi:hypothetical protein